MPGRPRHLAGTVVPHPPWLVIVLVALLAGACGAGGGVADPERSATTLPGGDHVHALRATEDGALLLGLHGARWRSPDGVEWEQLGLEGRDATAVGVATRDGPLPVGGHDVLVRPTDGGETFEDLAPANLPSLDVHALAQALRDPSTVYAFVVGAGVFRSDDAGDSFDEVARA